MRLMTLLFSGVLVSGTAGIMFAQQGLKDSLKEFGQASKHVAEVTGDKVTTTTKKVVNKGAEETGKAAAAVQYKTAPKTNTVTYRAYSTKHVAQATGNKVATTSKNVVYKGAEVTGKGAATVEHKTGPNRAAVQ